MEIKKYAAIDIGSNAIRLLIANIIEKENYPTQYRKSSLVRVPIRLGADSFTSGIISKDNINRMTDAMKAFKLLMGVHGVEKFKACATSAMREATNGTKVVEHITKKAGITIDVIDGRVEAAIIASTNLGELVNAEKSYLYVDVGGGSTEFTFFSHGKVIASKSFKLGTVRYIDQLTDEKVQQELEKWITSKSKDLSQIELIGSGGNINKIFKMSGRQLGKPLSFNYLKTQFRFLQKMTYEERVADLGLNPDRADVIIPAIKIYINAMKWCNANYIHVPKIGLSDGIIRGLHQGKLK